MKLDIDRLNVRTYGRGSGKTVRMIANLMGNVGYPEGYKDHVVVVPSGRGRRDHMVRSILDVATAMGEPIRGRRLHLIEFANGANVRVVSPENIESLRGCRYRMFYEPWDFGTVDRERLSRWEQLGI